MRRFIKICIFTQGFLLILSCNNRQDTKEANKVLIKTYFDQVWNHGRVDLLDSLLSPGYINHTPSVPNPPKGPSGLKPIVRAIRKAFPDLHYQIKEIIATDTSVVARLVMTGTQTDTLFGIPPTGKAIKVNQVNIERIENGKIAEHWRVTDELTMMKQLGIIKD